MVIYEIMKNPKKGSGVASKLIRKILKIGLYEVTLNTNASGCIAEADQ